MRLIKFLAPILIFLLGVALTRGALELTSGSVERPVAPIVLRQDERSSPPRERPAKRKKKTNDRPSGSGGAAPAPAPVPPPAGPVRDDDGDDDGDDGDDSGAADS